MNISFRRCHWIVAGAALMLAGALVVGTRFRADGAEVGAQVKPVSTEKLANVPGKSLTAILVSYAPGGKSGPHHHAGSVLAYVLSGRSVLKIPRPDRSKSIRPAKASLSRLEVGISSARMRA